MQKEMRAWANNHGSFAEEYFFYSFENGEKNFFGERFDEIESVAERGISRKLNKDIPVSSAKITFYSYSTI